MMKIRIKMKRPATATLVIILLSLPWLAAAQPATAVTALLDEQCRQCHNLTGPAPTTLAEMWARKGPDLFYAGNKYRQEWLGEWLQRPQRIRPAGMFYANHVRASADGDVIDESTLTPHVSLSADQARAVAKHLMTLTAKTELITAGDYKPGTVLPMIGEMMFDKFRGCLACHEIEPGYGGVSGPEVYTAAKRLQADYLISFMRRPSAWDATTLMPNKSLKEQDLQKFVHYFRGLSEVKF